MYDPDEHHRRSVRLRGFDYSQPGQYFVTLCARDMKNLFGRIAHGQVALSPIGTTAQQCWMAIPQHFRDVGLDEYIVMPNHMHGIVMIREATTRDAQGGWRNPALEQFARPVGRSLATIFRLFKQAVTTLVRARHGVPLPMWQRNYYEHVIRNPGELEKIREYIRLNPLRWACDRYNPERGVLVTDGNGGLTPWA